MAKGKQGPKSRWKWNNERLDVLAADLLEWIKDDENYLVGRFAESQGTWPARMAVFAKRHPKFKSALKKAKLHQEQCIFEGALNNEYNATIAKLGLMHNHGWAEKKETKNENTGSVNISVSFEDGGKVPDKT